MQEHPTTQTEMGFPSDMYDVIPKPIVLFFLYIAYLRFAALVALRFLGLYASSEPIISPWEEHEFYFPDDDPRDSPPTKPVPASPLKIKRQLRVVEFNSLGWRCHVEDGDDDDNGPTCVICLGNLAAWDKVRKLGNCTHGFHVECIDKWVDSGRVSCPLCRADLLPIKEDDKWRSLVRCQLWTWFN